MARRFKVSEKDMKNIDEDKIEIYGSEVKHIQVLRNNVGDKITVNENICEIINIKKDSIVLEILENAPRIGEPNINLTLYMAVLKNDKLDFVVQKAIELGVKRIIPFFSKNTVVKLDEKGKIKRKEKLQIVADEACKQCGRTDEVFIDDFINFDEILKDATKYSKIVLAYEKETSSLRDSLNIAKNNKFKDIGIVIGPEGGFDKTEYEKLLKIDNVSSVSLGSRILRAETAALNLICIVMYELDNK